METIKADSGQCMSALEHLVIGGDAYGMGGIPRCVTRKWLQGRYALFQQSATQHLVDGGPGLGGNKRAIRGGVQTGGALGAR